MFLFIVCIDVCLRGCLGTVSSIFGKLRLLPHHQYSVRQHNRQTHRQTASRDSSCWVSLTSFFVWLEATPWWVRESVRWGALNTLCECIVQETLSSVCLEQLGPIQRNAWDWLSYHHGETPSLFPHEGWASISQHLQYNTEIPPVCDFTTLNSQGIWFDSCFCTNFSEKVNSIKLNDLDLFCRVHGMIQRASHEKQAWCLKMYSIHMINTRNTSTFLFMS